MPKDGDVKQFSGRVVDIEQVVVTGPDGKPRMNKWGRPMTKYVTTLDSTDDRIDCGFKRPPFDIGHEVSLSAVYKYKTWNWDTSAPVTAGQPATKPAAAAKAPVPTGRTFPVAVDSPEMSIIRQNALQHAARIIASRDIPKAVTDDAVAERVIAMAYKFAEFASGQREVKAARTKVLLEAEGPPPAAAESDEKLEFADG